MKSEILHILYFTFHCYVVYFTIKWIYNFTLENIKFIDFLSLTLPPINSKFLKEIVIGFLLFFNIKCLKTLSDETIKTLGQNSTISPFIFFMGLLLLMELILYLTLFSKLNISEISLWGTKLVLKGFTEYKEGQDKLKDIIKEKIESQSKVLSMISCYGDEIINDITGSKGDEIEGYFETYINELKKILTDYKDNLRSDNGKAVSIEIYRMKDMIINNIKRRYRLNSYNMFTLADQVFKDINKGIDKERDSVLIEQGSRSMFFIPVKSKIVADYLLVVMEYKETFVVKEEGHIIQDIISVIDEFVVLKVEYTAKEEIIKGNSTDTA